MSTTRASSESPVSIQHSAALQSSLPPALRAAVDDALRDWRDNHKTERLWQRDSSLWTGEDESKWMGWLDIVREQVAQLDVLENAGRDAAGFRDALLLGM